jgi:23S rRNA (pseudouridine1915-N3)-methyltransferase
MLSLSIISVGRLREKHYISAFAEYEKRLRAYCKLETLELAEARLSQKPSKAELDQALKREAQAIRNSLSPGAFVVALCVEGEQLSSESLAALLSDCANSGRSRIAFVVGSSLGLDESLKSEADFRLSMSKMTFPHHLARVMLAEQLYRGIMINEGSKYHK